MRLLNLGCGAVREGDPWTNLDELFGQLDPWSPEMENLQNEARVNYVDFKIGSGPLPFEDETFSGILASHCVEHFDAIEGLKLMQECHRILKPGGHLVVSVPDCSYFKSVIDRDNIENAQELFGEPIHLPDGHTTFFDYALWMRQHKAILNEDSLWCYFKRAGFAADKIFNFLIFKNTSGLSVWEIGALPKIAALLNRLKFSVVLVGEKG